MHYHAIAILPGDRRKTIVNKTEQQMLTQIVIPFVSSGIIEARWGAKMQSYQVIDLRVYKTTQAWDKRIGQSLEDFVASSRNIFARLQAKAERALGKKTHRVFVIMPIQGEKFGTQNEQRIYQEFDKRFEAIESLLSTYDCVAIRIDKEHPIEDLVNRIKDEIRKAAFLIADLTDERPSCYFEAGFAEGVKRPIIYVASKESVITPGTPTKIHFDIHMNVNYFTNFTELRSKLKGAIDKNYDRLFSKEADSSALATSE